jgi:hypothetical protein
MYSFEGAAARWTSFARVRECIEQHADPLRGLGMSERRVEARERRMAQDVDRRTASASASSERPARASRVCVSRLSIGRS